MKKKKFKKKKAAAHNDELKDKVSQINKELKDLSDKIDKLEKIINRYNVMPNEIKNQEAAILSKVKKNLQQRNSPISNLLDDDLFKKKFEVKTINTKNLMEYSNQLSQLEMMLGDLYEPPNNSSLIDTKKEMRLNPSSPSKKKKQKTGISSKTKC
ncbi:hypothetical protein BsIDN1_56340 [Bacillus safensis]|uniref:Uncharacterized protein n=1 Tax=Bacillus safensis TaxID=561879 RepID=A0A5S9MK69_BACIA|nr:hypothetical protein BsIDN1_56340 [Bacillus safensis]